MYVQSDTLLLADVFKNFKNKCIEIYELDPANCLSAPGLAWQACLKKTEAELELLTKTDMLRMVEKDIRGEIYHATQRYLKANNNMKNYDKDIERSSPECNSIECNSVERSSAESSYLMYLDANNLYG